MLNGSTPIFSTFQRKPNLTPGQIEYRSRIENWRILWVTSPGDSTAPITVQLYLTRRVTQSSFPDLYSRDVDLTLLCKPVNQITLSSDELCLFDYPPHLILDVHCIQCTLYNKVITAVLYYCVHLLLDDLLRQLRITGHQRIIIMITGTFEWQGTVTTNTNCSYYPVPFYHMSWW